jgi:hypothetical protein
MRASLPPLIIMVTGRGPLREEFKERLSEMTLRSVSFHFAWLAPDQYARLLASADLGVSLHASSSDLDLPMKVSDMLGWCVALTLSAHVRPNRLKHWRCFTPLCTSQFGTCNAGNHFDGFCDMEALSSYLARHIQVMLPEFFSPLALLHSLNSGSLW